MKKIVLAVFAVFCMISCAKNEEYVPVSMIGLNTFDLHLPLRGDPQGVQATVLPSNATNQELSWVSQDETVATVSQYGLVTPRAVGVTWVVVTAKDNGVNTRFKVTVSDVEVLVTNIALDPQEITRRTDSDAKKLTVNVFPTNADDKTLIWSSTDETVAIVSNGIIAPMGVGTATIKAVAKYGGASVTCSVLVKAQGSAWVIPESVTLDKVRLSLYPGKTCQLRPTVLPYESDSKDLLWETADESIATVVGGLVFALQPGETVITAKTLSGGYQASCELTVVDPAEE